MTVDFVCDRLAKLIGSPCELVIDGLTGDEWMDNYCGEWCSAHCSEDNYSQCWKKMFSIMEEITHEDVKKCRRCGKPTKRGVDFCEKCYTDFCNFLDGKDYSTGYEQGQKDLYSQIVRLVQVQYPEAYWRFKNARANN